MKKWTKILCFAILSVFALAGVLTGCATVGNIKNTETEIIMNGTGAALVGNHLYFANAFSDSVTSEAEYSTAAATSYLARVDTTALGEDVDQNFSPKLVEKVAGNVTGFSGSFMFVLGQNIYYATPNTQMITKTDEEGNKTTEHHYDYTTFYKSALNGDGQKKLLTTTEVVSQCEALKCDGKYYIVVLAGSELFKINLSNDSVEKIEKEDEVTSVALQKTYQKNIQAEADLNFDGYVYYAINRPDPNGSGLSGTIVKRVKLSGGEAEPVYNQQTAVSLLGRDKDYVFYSESYQGQQWICRYDVTSPKNSFGAQNVSNRYYCGGTTQEETTFHRVETDSGRVLGYVFMIESTMHYVSNDGAKSGTVKFVSPSGSEETTFSLMFVKGRTAYIVTAANIYRAGLEDIFNSSTKGNEVDCTPIVTMTSISSGAAYAFDGENIYFYAGLQELPKDETEDEEESEEEETPETETDETNYLYRASLKVSDASKNYQLLGQTKIASRRYGANKKTDENK